jgi:hypothetical protein
MVFLSLINLEKNGKNVKLLKINKNKDKYENYQRPGWAIRWQSVLKRRKIPR